MVRIDDPSENIFDNAIRRIKYETLVAAAEDQDPGTGDSFSHLAPDFGSTFKETERRKGELVEAYLFSSAAGSRLSDMPNDLCYLDVSCGNDLSEWVNGIGEIIKHSICTVTNISAGETVVSIPTPEGYDLSDLQSVTLQNTAGDSVPIGLSHVDTRSGEIEAVLTGAPTNNLTYSITTCFLK